MPDRIDFADPYKTCDECAGWITGIGGEALVPCGHHATYTDQCPSWGPVDGCSCQEHLGYVSHGEPPVPPPSEESDG